MNSVTSKAEQGHALQQDHTNAIATRYINCVLYTTGGYAGGHADCDDSSNIVYPGAPDQFATGCNTRDVVHTELPGITQVAFR